MRALGERLTEMENHLGRAEAATISALQEVCKAMKYHGALLAVTAETGASALSLIGELAADNLDKVTEEVPVLTKEAAGRVRDIRES